MTNYARVRLVVLVTTIVAALGFASAQQVAPPAVPAAVRAATLEQAVPVDPLITVGTLPNGMRYYVRENRQPGARAELRLAVKAGSVLEDEDQRGMAHFVEHMAFNGTTHFPGNAVGTFMQSLGVRFGAHVNAHTGFDETVYELQIPTDNPNVVDRSLLILEDFARAVTFDPTEINQERGVILEEWRLGLGADERIHGHAVSAAAQRVALRRPDADRQARDHSQREPRPAEAVLYGLVSPRHDGGDRRRRLQQGQHGVSDPIALRIDPGGDVSAAETELHGAGSNGHDVLRAHRSRGDEHAHQRHEHDDRA